MRLKRKAKRKLIFYLIRLLAVLSWLATILFIIFFPPRHWSIIAGFLAIFFLAVWLSGLVLTNNPRLAGLIGVFLTGLLILQLFRQLHWLNLVLLIAFCLAILFHWRRLDKI